MYLENIIGSKAKVKILRVLIEVRTAYTLKDLVKETGLSLSITHQAAEELAEEGIVIRLKGRKKERLYKFNAESSFATALFELFKNEKTRQRNDVILLKTWNVLEQMLTAIKKETNLIILFGSQARGEATVRSDIDLFIIPKGRSGGLTEKIKNISSTINPHFVTMDAFTEGLSKKMPLYVNLQKEGVFLFINRKVKDKIMAWWTQG